MSDADELWRANANLSSQLFWYKQGTGRQEDLLVAVAELLLKIGEAIVDE